VHPLNEAAKMQFIEKSARS